MSFPRSAISFRLKIIRVVNRLSFPIARPRIVISIPRAFSLLSRGIISRSSKRPFIESPSLIRDSSHVEKRMSGDLLRSRIEPYSLIFPSADSTRSRCSLKALAPRVPFFARRPSLRRYRVIFLIEWNVNFSILRFFSSICRRCLNFFLTTGDTSSEGWTASVFYFN